jgi:2-phosphoglycolate phosphatase
MFPFQPAAVLFDLDGTLADTADDLAAPVNAMRTERGLDPLPIEALRPFASMGARGLILRGLGVSKEAPEFESLRLDFLARYEQAMCVRTRLFDGIETVLSSLESAGVRWGVVSNKVERYVRPILDSLGVLTRSGTTIGGDTTPHAKPHPEPLLLAARTLAVEPSHCVYVGDDLRDIQAGHAAGMATVAAAYGFCGDHDPPERWGAHALIGKPIDLLGLLALPAQ